MTKKYTMNMFYRDVEKFNSIAGVFEECPEEKADLYLSLVFEELSETIKAFEERDSVELMDGCVDVMVTAFGLAQVLQKAGFDVEKAMKKVAENNLAKFPSAVEGCRHLKEFTATINKEHNVYVIRDDNGKIRKHEDFQPVDISDCVPKAFFKAIDNKE